MSRIAGLAVLAVLMALVAAFPAASGAVTGRRPRRAVPEPPKTPTAVGSGGSAATVDPLATQTAIDVLRSGGNAVDAAVAAAGVLGVTEPFSCGIGGGGFMVIYDAKHRKVDTIDSREAAPARMDENSFFPYKDPSQFTEAYVSGLSVGVPGTVRRLGEGAQALRHSLPALARCGPAERIAREGFVIDPTFNGQVTTNAGDLRRLHLDARALPRREDREAGRRRPAQPRPGRGPTSASATTPTASTAAGSRATSCRPSSTRRRRPTPTARTRCTRA